MNFFENSMTINIRFRSSQTDGYVSKRNLREYIENTKGDRLRFQGFKISNVFFLNTLFINEIIIK